MWKPDPLRAAVVMRAALVMLAGAVILACEDPAPPSSSYFDERIAPVLKVGCVEQTASCHIATLEGTAAGNLDLSSYDALMRREDVLPAYGPYPVGLLFLKGSGPVDINVDTLDPPDPSKPDERFVRITTDIRHNAGQGIQLSSEASNLLKQWIAAGYTRTGVADGDVQQSTGACRNGVGTDRGFDASAEPANAEAYSLFKTSVQPILKDSCAGGGCHASPIADLYLACGDTEEELRWNYFVSVEHLANPVSTSELLRRPLAVGRGGTFHEGGDVFSSTDDPRYVAIRDWAEALVKDDPGAIVDAETDAGFRFFANRVQPVLVRKGCAFLNCHSPAMFHDFRFRGGSQGTFSRVATRKNYEMSKALLAYDSPNPNDSRIIAKNLYPADDVPGGQGMAHRGGFLFEDFGVIDASLQPASPALCASVDADSGDLNEIPAYCVLARWHAIERELAVDRGEITDPALSGIVWVARDESPGDFRDFDTFRGGADLRFASATLDGEGAVTLGASASLLGECGLGASPDVRTPAVSWDGKLVAFAARATAGEPLRLYSVKPDGTDCAPIAGAAAAEEEGNGIAIHDFDPAFAPDGEMVFASTRGHLGEGYAYTGPTRTPASLAPNANLYVLSSDGSEVRELTFLLNQELAPSFMSDGRVIFTTEKREPDFHQLAGRRQNLDGGDYHPLFAQRPSVGFEAAREVIELPNRNLVMVAGPLDAVDGAGTLAVVNRSIGPDQNDRDPADTFYIHSLSFPAPGAFGGMTGAYRSPAPLPGGRILASCDLAAASLTEGTRTYELCEIDPHTGSVRTVGGEPGLSNVETVVVAARAQRGVFQSRIDEPNGHTLVVPGETDAVIQVQDMPLLATLLFSNTRTGRAIDDRMKGVRVYEALPPPSNATSFSDLGDQVVDDAFGQVFVNYSELGTAPIAADGSMGIRIPGGTPIVLAATDAGGDILTFGEGAPFTGDVIQREQMQFYPGERANQSLQRRFFAGLCGGCHGSITNRELEIAVDVDVLTGASRTESYGAEPFDLRR